MMFFRINPQNGLMKKRNNGKNDAKYQQFHLGVTIMTTVLIMLIVTIICTRQVLLDLTDVGVTDFRSRHNPHNRNRRYNR